MNIDRFDSYSDADLKHGLVLLCERLATLCVFTPEWNAVNADIQAVKAEINDRYEQFNAN